MCLRIRNGISHRQGRQIIRVRVKILDGVDRRGLQVQLADDMDAVAFGGTVGGLRALGSVVGRDVPRHAGGVVGAGDVKGVGDVEGLAGGLFALAVGAADARGEQAREEVCEERAQGRQAGADDGNVGFDE